LKKELDGNVRWDNQCRGDIWFGMGLAWRNVHTMALPSSACFLPIFLLTHERLMETEEAFGMALFSQVSLA